MSTALINTYTWWQSPRPLIINSASILDGLGKKFTTSFPKPNLRIQQKERWQHLQDALAQRQHSSLATNKALPSLSRQVHKDDPLEPTSPQSYKRKATSMRTNRRNGTARYPETDSFPLVLERREPSDNFSELRFSDIPASIAQSVGSASDAGFSRSSLASSSHPQPAVETETETEAQLTVNTHLSEMYNGDMFEPLFSNVFSELDAFQPSDSPPSYDSTNYTPPTSTTFPFSVFFNDFVPFQDGLSGVSDLTGHPQPSIQPAVSHIRHVPSTSQEEVMDAEQNHYLHLFYTVFSDNLPIVHTPTFGVEGRPALLLKAMQACGALFLKTRQAASFIMQTLATTRETLADEFTKLDTGNLTESLNLILAVVLLQTVGLFHQRSDQRASSSLYHGMLLMMIRRSRFLNKVAEWSPDSIAHLPPDVQWREWGTHETAKRTILLSYLHDCCQGIFFALPPSYQANEMLIDLPCENAIWEAKSSSEWWIALQQNSPYGTVRSRLLGSRMIPVVAAMSETRSWETTPPPLSPFAHWIVIHSILVRLFVAFLEHPVQKDDNAPGGALRDPNVDQEICIAQYSLHNWFKSWMHCLEPVKIPPGDEEPPFMQHALPFYWLGQIALMAYQEGLPPFQPFQVDSVKRAEVRFRQLKQWLKHIRGFLKRTGNAPTLVWDELMRIRLQTWQSDSADDGLLVDLLDHLIVVPGHAVWHGSKIEDRLDEDFWTLEPYQKNGGRPEVFFQHISKGVELSLEDTNSLLVFSGGQTRRASTTTEGESYLRLASQAKLFRTTSSNQIIRATTENYALDSFQNLLFSIARFQEVTGRYPSKITVVGYEMKRRRFMELHRAAIRWPKDRFRYIGVDLENEDGVVAREGEIQNGYQPYSVDLYGCHSLLLSKRRARNPFSRFHPYYTSSPELRHLMDWCPDDTTTVFSGSLPWD
uniref:Xylanolytic transcriptional activator regulatory domain-containing protein n=1 Tax=Moniliophthora roreri TaxID=221103 RepID=A0A0W0FWN4_MONRR